MFYWIQRERGICLQDVDNDRLFGQLSNVKKLNVSVIEIKTEILKLQQ